MNYVIISVSWQIGDPKIRLFRENMNLLIPDHTVYSFYERAIQGLIVVSGTDRYSFDDGTRFLQATSKGWEPYNPEETVSPVLGLARPDYTYLIDNVLLPCPDCLNPYQDHKRCCHQDSLTSYRSYIELAPLNIIEYWKNFKHQ